MRRTLYTLLLCLLIGYCTFFVYTAQNAFAAPRVIARPGTVYTSIKQTYAQYEDLERSERMKKWPGGVDYPSTNRVEMQFQSNVLRNVHSSQYHAQSSFSILWLPVKLLDLPSLWKQKRDNQEKINVDDYGE